MVIKRNFNIYIALLICGMFCCASCDRTETPIASDQTQFTKTIERGPFAVTIILDSDHITIADTLTVQLSAKSANAFKVRFPELDSSENAIDDLELIQTQHLDDRLDENNNVISTIYYRFEPFITGNLQIPSMSVVFYSQDDPDNESEIVTEPIDIQIDSVLNLPSDSQPQIADIEDVMTLPVDPTLIWVVVAVIIITIAVIAYLLWKKKNAPAKIVRIFKPAHQLAFEKLHELVAQNLLNQGKIKLFYIGISNVLRYYIEHRFKINAPDQTTEEFLGEVTSANTLSISDKDRLADFLHHCDLVKFAKHAPTSEQNEKTIHLVRDFIEKTASLDCQVDITDADETKHQQGGL